MAGDPQRANGRSTWRHILEYLGWRAANSPLSRCTLRMVEAFVPTTCILHMYPVYQFFSSNICNDSMLKCKSHWHVRLILHMINCSPVGAGLVENLNGDAAGGRPREVTCHGSQVENCCISKEKYYWRCTPLFLIVMSVGGRVIFTVFCYL